MCEMGAGVNKKYMNRTVNCKSSNLIFFSYENILIDFLFLFFLQCSIYIQNNQLRLCLKFLLILSYIAWNIIVLHCFI